MGLQIIRRLKQPRDEPSLGKICTLYFVSCFSKKICLLLVIPSADANHQPPRLAALTRIGIEMQEAAEADN